MGEVYARLGQFDRSMPLLERSLELILSLESPLPELVLEARVRLGDLYRNLDQTDRAMEVLAPIPEVVAEHPCALSPVGGLSDVNFRRGLVDESVTEALREVMIREKAYGPDSATLVPSLIDLAAYREGAGNLEPALAALQRAKTIALADEGDQTEVIARIDERIAELTASRESGNP